MKVFVTGNRGYIGPHLVDLLRAAGHQVTGCDLGLFDDCAWEGIAEPHVQLRKDVRNLTVHDLRGHDCVMHLAAISNDPMGDLNPDLTYSINRDGSIRLATLAKVAGVGRFLFAASCSVYGKGAKTEPLNEGDPLNPQTAYAISKIDTEREVARLADAGFSPSFLRNATAYGFSPNLRVDLVVNNLLASALSYGEIRIMSDGSPWRPLIHCRDIARAFISFMEAPRELVHNKAVNIGDNAENFQVKDIGDLVQWLLPDAKIIYTGEHGADSRDYRVSFDLLNRMLPEFKLQYDLKSGMTELLKKYREHSFSRQDFEGDKFVRLRALKKHLGLLG